ncbi:SAM-dependent methyltransferase [Streptomyces sp. NPDC002889]|uniref:SAM-dependent methyltransferase n=1 Tax=Streptomyces sp. NPDC002889 TaxID=3364669 RepID=UPI0036C14C0E
MIRTPKRLAWAVQQLSVRPDDRLLEIGCGRGIAVALVADRLRTGTITAIDRSAHAVAGARQRNAAHLARGRAELRHTALAELKPAPERYDKIFAVNVDVFWVETAARELSLVRSLLAPLGTFSLFYEPPEPDRASELEAVLLPKLDWPGWATVTVREKARRSTLLGIHVTVA